MVVGENMKYRGEYTIKEYWRIQKDKENRKGWCKIVSNNSKVDVSNGSFRN